LEPSFAKAATAIILRFGGAEQGAENG
jgi:hypothetical protein